MKRELGKPAIIAVILIVIVSVAGALFYSTKGPGDGARPGNSAGGIHTLGGKVLPTAAGASGSSSAN
jgi:hypothetical protein